MLTIEKYPKITRGSKDIRTKNSVYWIIKDYIITVKNIIDNAENKKEQQNLIKKLNNTDVYLKLKILNKDNSIVGYELVSNFIVDNFKNKKYTYINTPDNTNYKEKLLNMLPKKYTGFVQILHQKDVEDFLYLMSNKYINEYNDNELINKENKYKEYLNDFNNDFNNDKIKVLYSNNIKPSFYVKKDELTIKFTYDSNNLTTVYFDYEIFIEETSFNKEQYKNIIENLFDKLLSTEYLNLRKLIIVFMVKEYKYNLNDLLNTWYPKIILK